MIYTCYLCGAQAPQGYMIPEETPKGLHIEAYVCKECYRKYKQEMKE